MVALPLNHREKVQNNKALIDEDRNILFSYIKDKLAVTHHIAEVYQFCFPEFKVSGQLLPNFTAHLDWDSRLACNCRRRFGKDGRLTRVHRGTAHHKSEKSSKQ